MTDKAAEKPALRKPQFVKIKDLERGRSGYNVYVKVVEAKERQVDTRDGQKITMIDAVVADETGSARAFFKGEQAKGIKEGAIVAIRNGVKKIIKGHISLELDLFGRVTPQTVQVKPSTEKNISDEEIKFQPRANNRRQGGRPRGRRQFNDNRNQDRRGGEGRRFDNRRGGDRRDNRDNREDRRDNRDNREERRDNREERRDNKQDRRDNRDNREERRDNREERKDNREDRRDNRENRDNREDRRDNREDRRDNRDNRQTRRYDDRRDNYRRDNRDYNRRNDDRDYDRRERNYDNRDNNRNREFRPRGQQERRGERRPMIKINEIDPGTENLRFIAKVLSVTLVSGRNGSNVRCVLGDDTGTVNAFLQENELLAVGKTVALFGAEARVVNEHIEIQRARVETARNPIDKVNEKFNLSEKAWVPVD